jgi:hypothetical protein
MKATHELKVLRWAVVVLFGLQIVQFARPLAWAAPAVPGSAVVGQPKMTATAAPTTAALSQRLDAMQSQIYGLITYTNNTQNQLENAFYIYLHHRHNATWLGYQQIDNINCTSSTLGISNICTHQNGSGRFTALTADVQSPNWRQTSGPVNP